MMFSTREDISTSKSWNLLRLLRPASNSWTDGIGSPITPAARGGAGRAPGTLENRIAGDPSVGPEAEEAGGLPAARLSKILRCVRRDRLHDALVKHGVGHLQEARYVRAGHVVAGQAVLVGGGDACLVDVAHDAVQALVHLFARCLLYTSDAADDLLCVDLGGRRI